MEMKPLFIIERTETVGWTTYRETFLDPNGMCTNPGEKSPETEIGIWNQKQDERGDGVVVGQKAYWVRGRLWGQGSSRRG